MRHESLDTYLLAGLDDRERGFSRPVEFEQGDDGYRAILRYESIRIETECHPTQNVALAVLIQTLQTRGYRQLRTQMSYRNGTYLGSQELWIEYPDAPQAEPTSSVFLAKLLNWFRSCVTKKQS